MKSKNGVVKKLTRVMYIYEVFVFAQNLGRKLNRVKGLALKNF